MTGMDDLDARQQARARVRLILSVFIVLLIVALVAYLTMVQVPPGNREIILTLLSVLVGGASAAMPNLVGDPEQETDKLKLRIRELEHQLERQKQTYDAEIAQLQAENRELRQRLDAIMTNIVSSLATAPHTRSKGFT